MDISVNDVIQELRTALGQGKVVQALMLLKAYEFFNTEEIIIKTPSQSLNDMVTQMLRGEPIDQARNTFKMPQEITDYMKAHFTAWDLYILVSDDNFRIYTQGVISSLAESVTFIKEDNWPGGAPFEMSCFSNVAMLVDLQLASDLLCYDNEDHLNLIVEKSISEKNVSGRSVEVLKKASRKMAWKKERCCEKVYRKFKGFR